MPSKPKRPPHPEIPLGTKCSVWWCTDHAHPHSRTWDGKGEAGGKEVLHVSEYGVITLHSDGDVHSAAEITPAQAVAWFNRHPLIPMPADIEKAAKRSSKLADVPALWTGHLRRLRDLPDFAAAPPDEALKRIGEVLIAGAKAGAFKDAAALAKPAKAAVAKDADPKAMATAFAKAAKAAGYRVDDEAGTANGMLLGTLAGALDRIIAGTPPPAPEKPAAPEKGTGKKTAARAK